MNRIRAIATALSFVLLWSFSYSQDAKREEYVPMFEQAAREFGVPADILKGIAFAETRWDQLMWADGDTASACNGMPRPYGIMSLWNNSHFGHSLFDAARMIGRSPDELKRDPLQNIRGAAALLRKFHDERPLPEGTAAGDIESWSDAIAAYCGIPQGDLAQQHALDVYTHMIHGYHGYGIEWRPCEVNLDLVRTHVNRIQESIREARMREGGQAAKPAGQPDYPLAKWVSAAAGHWYTSGNGRNFVVIHDMEGYYVSTISYFQMASTQASAHFCVNSGYQANGRPAGEITQMVELQYWAWHVVCWNLWMIGIEHEGFVNNGAWYTNEMYQSSAKLTSFICDKFNIPKDRNHIIGHSEWQNVTWKTWLAANYPSIDPTCNTHTDPGANWNWPLYMSLMMKDTIPPKITAATPSTTGFDLVPAYKDIVIQFSSPMDATSTNAALSITPSIVNMTKTWNEDSRQMTIHATPRLEFGMSYTVRIAATAKSIAGLQLDGNGDGTGGDAYQFSFTTVPLDTSGPAVAKSYPVSGAVVPVLADVSVRFDEPVVAGTLAGRVLLESDSGRTVSYTSSSYATINDQGVIGFTPVGLLATRQYRIRFKAGLADLYGNITKNEIVIPFSTDNNFYFDGRVIDSFESNLEGWSQPRLSPGNADIDSNATAFAITAEKKRYGAMSAKLSYGFTKLTGGLAVFQAAIGISVDSAATIGLWVNGDNSNNVLELVLSPGNQTISLGNLNWMGWRIIAKEIPNAAAAGKKIAAIRIRQSDSGTISGNVYIDDLQLDAYVQTVVKRVDANPVTYYLSQNYPNPFNPSTSISFAIPSRERVRLAVFDALGREVAILADGLYEAGLYSVSWKVGNLPSGIYFYTLAAGKFCETKKLMVLK
ncbi:MAG: Ig-like domain-containing protein [Ignavibacteriales bacterium]|nr:Ig-like domain-containing protein [Ignavibacteriales bacterium]